MTEDILRVLQATFLVVLSVTVAVMLLTGLSYDESVSITVKILSVGVFMTSLLHPLYKTKEKIKRG